LKIGAEAEQRRAAAREERVQAESVRQTADSVAETMAITVAFPVHLARRTAETARENVRFGLDTAGLSVFPCAGGGLNITLQWLL
jgi:hypothetical protein